MADLGLRGVLSGTLLFGLLVGARFLGGILSSATLPTAQAMMADLTDKQNRAAAMGLIGAAFGLGVIFGPGLGGVLANFGLTVPVYFSAGLGLVTALLARLTLRETRAPGTAAPASGNRFALARGPITVFLVISALFTLASVGMEQTISFYVQDNLKLTVAQTPQIVGGMLALFGLISAAVQGGAIRPLSKKLSPTALIPAGLTVMAAGMFALSAASMFWTMTASLALIGVGSAILGPASRRPCR